MTQNSAARSTNVRPDNSGTMQTRPQPKRTGPKHFPNLAALLASRPDLTGNPVARNAAAAYEAGRAMLHQLADSFALMDGADLPLDDFQQRSRERSRVTMLDRIPQGLASSYGYAWAFADAEAERLSAHMANEEADAEGIAGFASRTHTLMLNVMERDAQAAWLADVIHGATDAFTELTGEEFKIRPPADRGMAVRTEEQAKAVAAGAAAFLARRKG